MLIVPAMIVAIGCGTLAAILAFASGFGWKAALIGYWLAGNLGILAAVLPSLFSTSDNGDLEPSARDKFGSLVSVAMISLGLAMIFLQNFHIPLLMHGDSPSYQIGAVLNLAETHSDGLVYAVSQGVPGLFAMTIDHVLRLELWVAGLLLYALGLAQAGLVLASRFAQDRDHNQNSEAY
ncbi:hypothetical protein PAF17_10120 [Paracoccus sp. Z330]|uniref:Uncharacterized protein n=1 Tax=Paracoccus onchidii TaxID=3017813 RepID=A0ABT4ZFI3_9RHOB|nr:hypothetical protein [Paracoccus onchidii]MDB6177857.1 hypothetical protein [Paracoccus onchidii]